MFSYLTQNTRRHGIFVGKKKKKNLNSGSVKSDNHIDQKGHDSSWMRPFAERTRTLHDGMSQNSE